MLENWSRCRGARLSLCHTGRETGGLSFCAWENLSATPLSVEPIDEQEHARCRGKRHRACDGESNEHLPRSRCAERLVRDRMRQELVRLWCRIAGKRRAHWNDGYCC